MRAAFITREYPPEVYGGAGVHVEYLSAALAEHLDLEVHCFGEPRPDQPLVAGTYTPWEALGGEAKHLSVLEHFSTDLAIVKGVEGVDLVHSHTWYANLAGHFASLCYGIPHVMTTHSLEPHRPWKREQLAGGYELSSFAERMGVHHADAVIAVSETMRTDILEAYPGADPDRVTVIHNGIDAEEYHPVDGREQIEAYGLDPDRPVVVFVGRITRQKGVTHLLDAARFIDADAQMLLLAGAPDTEELAAEFRGKVETLREERDAVVWVEEMVPREQVVATLSGSTVFVCPSIYEPFGLVNIEAMACEIPVVASSVGGIPEIIVEDETGYLVDFEASDDEFGTPADPAGFARRLAERIDVYVNDPAKAEAHGKASRERVLQHFSWKVIAEQTAELYRTLA